MLLKHSIDNYRWLILSSGLCLVYISAYPFAGNLMDASNMAIVIGPNIAQNSKSSDYSEILAETELAQRLVEVLIVHVNEVFETPNNTKSDIETLPLLI